jgi:hypothetical protein
MTPMPLDRSLQDRILRVLEQVYPERWNLEETDHEFYGASAKDLLREASYLREHGLIE